MPESPVDTAPSGKEHITAPEGDPQIGNLQTPINHAPAVRLFLSWLPINRPGASPIWRGLEIGMAHGYWLVGPFAKLGPLRNEPIGLLSGFLGACGLILIMTAALSLYGTVSPQRNDGPVQGSQSWSELAAGFLVGGMGGAIVAYLLLLNGDLLFPNFG
ncbi:phosphorylase [Synechococcus sp. 60AY4M2]|uniref:photosystem I reaction center subunit XI n=1 Tax=unclassified Synechococcus TaxID=2626047 RepID=UPI000C1A36D4|nr:MULTISPECIES: photosystem I reaction center subunit XI [unclassified Synechococcus]PIK95068.1 phosphorylase [Synechococcus sp. 60AY4M2]PIK97321.1 phosphorylase [Synechococcus sp. 63AY4M1]PIL01969.1 phosphorylase [Synechococcus sp. 65AY640]